MQQKYVTLRGTIAVAILFAVLVILGGMHLRGTDQYWYIADTRTLLEGRPAHAQHVYPAQVLSPDFAGVVPFVHNALGLYLVIPLSWVAGPVLGWVLTNILLVLGSAAIVWWMVLRLANVTMANLACCLTLIYPASMWLATQPLLESGCMIFAALAAWFFVTAEGEKRAASWWGLFASLAGLTLCRIAYFPLIAAVPCIYLWYNRPLKTTSIITAIAMFLAVVGTYSGGKWAMPNGMPTSIPDLLNNGGPDGKDQMAFMYVTTPQPETAGHLTGRVAMKAGRSVIRQVPLDFTALFYWPFNIVAVVAVAGFLTARGDQLQQKLCLLAIGMLGIHVLQSVIHQNQLRYLIPGWPVILAAAVVTLDRWSCKLSNPAFPAMPIARYAGFTIIVMCCLLDTVLAIYLYKDGLGYIRPLEIVQREISEKVPVDATILIDANVGQPTSLWMEYAARPRTVVYLRDSVPVADCQTILDRTKPGFLIASDSSGFPARLSMEKVEIPMEWPSIASGFRLYRLEPRSASLAINPVHNVMTH
jgi:hypothetical protein